MNAEMNIRPLTEEPEAVMLRALNLNCPKKGGATMDGDAPVGSPELELIRLPS